MSCDICGSGSCCNSFHSLEEQERYEKVTEAFDHARELREQIHIEDEEERGKNNEKFNFRVVE